MDLFISGEKATGKTYSLKNLDQKNWIYIFSENKQSYKNNFNTIYVKTIEDVIEIKNLFDMIDKVTKEESLYPKLITYINKKYNFNLTEIKGIILDSVTSFQAIFEDSKITGKSEGYKYWGDYKLLFNHIKKIATYTKFPVIFVAHVAVKEFKNSNNEVYKTTKFIELKGGLKEGALDRDIGNIVLAKKMSIEDLENDQSNKSFLNITDRDRFVGFKYVFMVSPSIEEKDATIRFVDEIYPWDVRYVDNDINKILEKLYNINDINKE